MRQSSNRAKSLEKWSSEGELARALDALASCAGGAQLTLPGLETQRFFGIAPAPAADAVDDLPARQGRGRDALPAAFRAYLQAKYGSAVEGLSSEANRPIAAIAGELAQAFIAVSAAVGRQTMPTGEQISQWVVLAANLRQAARRYAAPYQTSPAPAQPAGSGSGQRVAVGLFTGRPDPAQVEAGGATLASVLQIEVNQEVSGEAAPGSDVPGSDDEA
jgi:hypothetical protein